MASSKRLIVGLGNPGSAYEETRHNIGFKVVDVLADRLKVVLKNKGHSQIAWGKWKGHHVGLAKPRTFMNRSGEAVQELVRKNKLSPSDILVLVDDINLDLGRVRIREEGGPGGHNGLEDIIDWVDSNKIPRLRMGIGSEFERGRQADYVLSSFKEDELKTVREMTETARDAALTFISEGIVTSMNRFSS